MGKDLDKTSRNIKIYEPLVESDDGIDMSMPEGIVRKEERLFALPGIA